MLVLLWVNWAVTIVWCRLSTKQCVTQRCLRDEKESPLLQGAHQEGKWLPLAGSRIGVRRLADEGWHRYAKGAGNGGRCCLPRVQGHPLLPQTTLLHSPAADGISEVWWGETATSQSRGSSLPYQLPPIADYTTMRVVRTRGLECTTP